MRLPPHHRLFMSDGSLDHATQRLHALKELHDLLAGVLTVLFVHALLLFEARRAALRIPSGLALTKTFLVPLGNLVEPTQHVGQFLGGPGAFVSPGLPDFLEDLSDHVLKNDEGARCAATEHDQRHIFSVNFSTLGLYCRPDGPLRTIFEIFMANPFDKPLTDDEFVEIGELLASIPEPFEPMEPDRMDGFLTALLLLPEEPSPQAWMPWIFDAEGRPEAKLADERDQDRLEELVYRRYRSIDRTICQRKPLDPILYEIEDERGHAVRGWEGIAAVEPFAVGFWEAADRWPGLLDHEDPLVQSALLGILRHLPDDLAGDLLDVKHDLELESPLENLDQTVEDIAVSVAEIASVTRGISLDAPERTPKKPVRKGPARHGRR